MNGTSRKKHVSMHNSPNQPQAMKTETMADFVTLLHIAQIGDHAARWLPEDEENFGCSAHTKKSVIFPSSSEHVNDGVHEDAHEGCGAHGCSTRIMHVSTENDEIFGCSVHKKKFAVFSSSPELEGVHGAGDQCDAAGDWGAAAGDGGAAAGDRSSVAGDGSSVAGNSDNATDIYSMAFDCDADEVEITLSQDHGNDGVHATGDWGATAGDAGAAAGDRSAVAGDGSSVAGNSDNATDIYSMAFDCDADEVEITLSQDHGNDGMHATGDWGAAAGDAGAAAGDRSAVVCDWGAAVGDAGAAAGDRSAAVCDGGAAAGDVGAVAGDVGAAGEALSSDSDDSDDNGSDDDCMYFDFEEKHNDNGDADEVKIPVRTATPSSSKSGRSGNTSVGRRTQAQVDAVLEPNDIFKTMNYEHPIGTKCCGKCDGIYMSKDDQESNIKEAKLLHNSIEQLRLHYHGTNKAQLLLDELWTQPDVSPTARRWKVGHRAVCHNCYCAAADFLQSPSMLRKGRNNNSPLN